MASILVTGASRGIGRAACVSLARAGHRVFATMRDPAKSPDLSAFASAASLPIVVSAMDVDSDDSVRQGVGDILAQHGPLDVLVNNAGIERRGSVEELALDEFRAVMETNYFGAIRCIKAVLPGMRTRGSGCIINVTSVAGRISVSPLGLKVCARRAERSTRPRGDGAGYQGCDCAARHHRHGYGQRHCRFSGQVSLSAR